MIVIVPTANLSCPDSSDCQDSTFSIHPFSSAYPGQGRGGRSLSQLSEGERRGPAWTGRQSVTGVSHRQPFTLTFKPVGNLEFPMNLKPLTGVFVGGRRRTRGEPTPPCCRAATPPCLRFHSQKLFQVFIESSLCFQLVGIHQCSKRIWCFLQRSTAKTNLKFGDQSSVRFTENQQRNKQNDKQDFYVFLQQWTYSDDLSVFVWNGCADSLEAVNLNLPRVSSSVSVSRQSADGNSSAARMVPFSCLRPCVSCLLYMTRCVDFETRTSDFGVHICLTVGKGVGFFGSFAN